MTIHEPQERVPLGTPGAPSRARRPDYRLRGLDLEAQQHVEVAPRKARKARRSGRQRRRLFLQWTAALTVVATTAVLLRAFVAQPYSVRSTAMVPTIWPGTDVLVVRPTLLTGQLHVGDIVVFHQPSATSCSDSGNGSQDLVKRVIGLPGQTIWSEGARIYVDGRLLDEPLRWYNPPYGEVGSAKIARTVIPTGSYFVMGDNRTDPCDSRSFGPIPGSSVVGKVVATTTRDGHPFAHIL